MLKKLDWFIIKSYLIPFIITFFIAEFVLVIQFLFVYLDDLIGKGVGFSVILELIFYAFLDVVPMALPLAVLLSSIMVMGNLGEKSELTAMKAAGVSLLRIMRPLIVIMIIIGAISFYFSNNIWGTVYIKKRILITDVTNKKLSLILKEGVFFSEIENYSIRANEIDKETNELSDVLIFEHSASFKYRKIIRAERGKMNKSSDGASLVLTLYNGEITEVVNPSSNPYEDKSILPHQQISFKETTQKIDISSLGLNRTSEDDYTNQPQTLPLSKLTYVIDSLSLDADTVKRTLLNYYKNSHLVSRIENSYDIDTIAKTAFNLDSLTPQQQKSIVTNAKNKVINAINYLETRSDEFEGNQKHLSKLQIEWHRKLTLSLACLILFFIGAPMGAIVKKGGFGVPIAIAIGMFLVYYIISITGERLASSLVLAPYIGMWLGSIVLFPLGVLLTYQAVTESKIMDFEVWGRFFRNIFVFTKFLLIKKAPNKN
jgi:lipopolysaccharide export system permease protein